MNRRKALLGGGIAVVGGAALYFGRPMIEDLLAGPPEYIPIADAPGFRRLADQSGSLSQGARDPFAGIDVPGTEAPVRVEIDNHCTALFERPPNPGVVPIAIFTDYNCPFCRVVEPRLIDMEQDPNSNVVLYFHNLPLLGEASLLGARAALAADKQGWYRPLHRALMGSGSVISEAYIMAQAERLGIDTDALSRDMEHPEIDQRLATSRALAGDLGVIGTPALVIGRTLALGALSQPRIEWLVAYEFAEGPMECSV